MVMEGLNQSSGKRIEMNPRTIEQTPPPLGGTLIMMQRHGVYDKTTGHLTNEGRARSLDLSRQILVGILEQIPKEERSKFNLLVVASPTQLHGGQRSMETAAAILESSQVVCDELGVPKEKIMRDTPRPEQKIEAPKMLKDSNPFRDFLETEYGKDTKEFWRAYENDVHKDKREAFGVEGPLDMGDRFADFVNVLGRYARAFHKKRKDNRERLVIWVVSHYDTVTTFFKNHIAEISQTDHVPVDYNGGMGILIDQNGVARTTIDGTSYPVNFT
jgi:hypothetical protein